MSSPYIVVSQLISAAVLQLPFVDKQGDPLTNGVVTFYKTDMVTLKNVYYQASFGNYIAAPNPMILSGAGTPMDVNGNDIILFYYPYDDNPLTFDSNVFQPYFVTAYDEFGTLQFTRLNFPFVGSPSAANTVATLENYILNNRFWRNIGAASLGTLTNTWTTQYNNSGSTFYYLTVAPDQHDGFSMPDFNYIKNVNGSATETVTFNTFSQTTTPILTGDVGPEYYLNHTCTADTSGSTLKVYQFPITFHLATLVAETFSFTIQGQSLNGGTANSTVSFYIYQFCGTGVSSPNPQFIGSKTFTNSWTKYELTGLTFPATTGLTLSPSDDDAYYLQIALPTGSSNGICDINFTLPSIYLSAALADIPTNSFSTYDQIDSIINTPRTGDLRTSLNNFYYFGWVPLNNGTIGNASSNATARANQDTWPLYNLIWTSFSNYNNSTTNILAQMVNSSGANVAYGSSAIADFNANKAITLSQTMGKVILGTVPLSAFQGGQYATAFTVTNVGGNLQLSILSGLTNLFNGMPFYVASNSGGTLPTGLSANTIYYMSQYNSGAGTFLVSTTFANAMAGIVIAFTNSGTPVNNMFSAITGSFEGEYAHTQLMAELAAHTHAPLSGNAFIVNAPSAPTNASTGSGSAWGGTATTSSTGSGTPFNVTQPGVFMNMYMKL